MADRADLTLVNRLCTFGGALIGGYLGWALASPLGFWWAFAISSLASLFGVYFGWKLAVRLA